MEVTATKRKRGEEENEERKEVKKSVPLLLSLPNDVLFEVAKHVHESEGLAFAMTCRPFRDNMKDSLKSRKSAGTTDERSNKIVLTTRVKHYMKEESFFVSEDWIKWASSMKWEYVAESPYRKEENKGKILTYLAARGGLNDVLGCLKIQGLLRDAWAWHGAALGGHVKVLEYLKGEGVPLDFWASRDAARGGHIDVLEYLRSEGMSFGPGECRQAALGGHLDVLKYLRSEGARFDWRTCGAAACRGDIEMLKYLMSEGARFDTGTTSAAAQENQLHTLKWLTSDEVNCPLNIGQCLYHGNFYPPREEMLRWIKSLL
jgi:hypothetical protein